MAFLMNYLRVINRSPILISKNTLWNSCLTSPMITARNFSKLPEVTEIQVPDPPKRPISSYLLFVEQKYPVLKKANPELRLMEIQKQISFLWKSLPKEEKEAFKSRYDLQKSDYIKKYEIWWTSLSSEQQTGYAAEKKRIISVNRKKTFKKKLKSLGYPSKKLNSFNFFVREKKTERGDKTNIEQLKDLMNQWKAMTVEEKQPFHELQLKDEDRYAKEMNVWRTRMIKEGEEDVLKRLDARRHRSSKTKTKVKAKKQDETEAEKQEKVDLIAYLEERLKKKKKETEK